MRILHRNAGGGVDERILALDGTGREFIRHGSELVCYLPDQRVVLVDSTQDSGMLLADFRRVDAASSGLYRVRELPATTLSNRVVRVIAVESRDQFRYGYRLWIDEKTAMPLKTQLRSARGAVVEQLWFDELSLPKQISDERFVAQTDTEGYRWLRQTPSNAIAANETTGASAWQSADLPPGFRMTVRSLQQLPGSEAEVTHLVFSDGLASVSVFVEQGTTPAVAAGMSASDVRRMGSSSTYSTVVAGYRVTAVGEVPPDTVKAIASSMLSAPRARLPQAAIAPRMSDGRGASAASAAGRRSVGQR
jgi:sigma-E factor negative regulatory protein RseB